MRAARHAGKKPERMPVTNETSNAMPATVIDMTAGRNLDMTSVIGQAMSTVSSYYGGVGSKGWGLVRIILRVYQESILSETSR